MFLSSLENLSASPFARVAQASHVLGQVVQHCNKTPEDLGLVKQSLELLTNVANSLLQLLTKDEESAFRFRSAIAICHRYAWSWRMWTVLIRTASCFSALLKLYDNHSCDSYARTLQGRPCAEELSLRREVTEDCVARGRKTVERVLELCSILASRRASSSEPSWDDAPWMLHCFYKSAANLIWYASSVSPLEEQAHSSQKAKCVATLQSASRRWKVAGNVFTQCSV
jgi:hypothetical protein